MEEPRLVCANCRVLVELAGGRWEHVPEFAVKFSDTVCADPAPGRAPSGSELRFGLARTKQNKDKLLITGVLEGFESPAGAPVTVATDGSYKLTVADGDRVMKPISYAYVATTGAYGLGTAIVPGRITGEFRALQGELRGINAALRAVGDQSPVLVLTDSNGAYELMELWRLGHTHVMPSGYQVDRAGGREATLARLAQRVHAGADRIRAQWIPGHAGHPLNEAADTLARLARAWATGARAKADAEALASPTVRDALRRYAAEPAPC